MYGPWFRKNLYLKLTGIGVEKAAIGTPIGTVPANKKQGDEELEAFKNMLGNFTAHESSFMVVPEGWKIEMIKGEFDSSKIKDLVIMENTEMINSLVANFLALGTNGGGGAYALGSDLSDFFLTGIQTYANLISGVWNRCLIPNLIKLNFGEQVGYPKLRASNINDKAGKELADILGVLLGNGAVKADMKLEEFLRKSYNLPKADPATARENPKTMAPAPYGNPQFSEKNIKLAEGYKTKWNNSKATVKDAMQSGLQTMLDDMIAQLERKYKSATPTQKLSLGLKIEPKTSDYEKTLRELLAEIANDALAAARKETPKAKNVKLSESIKLAAPKGGYYEALPPKVKQLVQAQAKLIAQTQGADLSKVVSFQYSSSQASTDDIKQIVADIEAATVPTIEGSTARGLSVDAAAGNAVSTIFNQAQLSWFFEPEVLNTIESFTFYNEDPISPICQELDGTTWAVNDPDLDRYSPPLHHNCKSRLVPNEKGADNNPEINRGGTPVSEKGLKSITLCECGYNVEIKLGEPNVLSDFSPDDQKKISDKIAKLINEGKNPDQAAAIAYDMARRNEL
jgi:hypothetical protein